MKFFLMFALVLLMGSVQASQCDFAKMKNQLANFGLSEIQAQTFVNSVRGHLDVMEKYGIGHKEGIYAFRSAFDMEDGRKELVKDFKLTREQSFEYMTAVDNTLTLGKFYGIRIHDKKCSGADLVINPPKVQK